MQAQRREAAQSFTKVLKENEKLFTLVLNVIAKDRNIDDKWRGFKTAVSSRNLANDVDDHVVDALADAVTSRMKDISHRYYQMKARWFGQRHWHGGIATRRLLGDDDRRYSWEEAKQIDCDSFAAFDGEMASIAQEFFDKNWVDAGITTGKASGAFSHPTVPSAHPYILMNFAGKARDVMTLAHEMGHGIHQVLACTSRRIDGRYPINACRNSLCFC